MRGSRGSVLVAVAVVVAVAGIAGCGSDAGSSSGGRAASFKLVIGDVEAYTGDLGALGAPIDRAVKLAAEQANAAAKQAAANVTVSVQSADTQSDPQTAVSAAR